MKGFLVTATIVTGSLLAGGCASKKYVRNTAAPIQAKVDQVGEQTNRNSQSIEETRNQMKQSNEELQNGISAASERAISADRRAGDADQKATTADQHAGAAMTKANQASDSADQANRGLDNLRQVVSNLDDYKLQSSVTVPFRFNQYRLTPESMADLDKLADQIKSGRRFFIAVEGYTDKVGDKQYNEALSRRRADSVVEYLVAKHDVPIYRIHMIGLGEEKPVDEGRNRAANARNRRVEVKVFSADEVSASLRTQGDTNADRLSGPTSTNPTTTPTNP
jgi:outer membrane protein OmpA-like peptidoglycan-associated protein